MSAARTIALLVNPHAAGGRTLRLLDRVHARLRALGLPFETERTDSLLHGCELAREAPGLVTSQPPAGFGETVLLLAAMTLLWSAGRTNSCSS